MQYAIQKNTLISRCYYRNSNLVSYVTKLPVIGEVLNIVIT